jgi:hypothetical protein
MTTATVNQVLMKSIESVGAEEFNSEFSTGVYLSGEKGIVYSFLKTGGIPSGVYNNLDVEIMSVPSGHVIGDTVLAALQGHAEEIQELLSSYQGSEWDGSNHRGQWNSQALEWFSECVAPQLSCEVGSYWNASDWFEPVIGELKDRWEAGETVEAIIDSENLGTNDQDGCCDKQEAVDWLQMMFEEWAEEDA